MPVQMTIIGLGQIGASIGLGLAPHSAEMRRVGHDKSLESSRQAEKLGAVDEVRINLPSAVETADIVVLAVPFDQVEENLKLIAPDLRADSVVLATAPLQRAALAWAAALLPSYSHYVGFVPALSPRYLLSSDAGIGGARADLFKKGLFAIANNPGAPAGAVQLATDLAGMLGAEYLFMDALEIDSQMGALHLLPQLLAAALASQTIQQPGWQEGRKLASRPYAWSVQNTATMESAQALAAAGVQNRENMLRSLDMLASQLSQIRAWIETTDQPRLAAYLQAAAGSQAAWWKERTAGDWSFDELGSQAPLPKSSDWLTSLFGLRPRSKKQ